MVNKHKVKEKQYVRLGIMKTPDRDFEYIDLKEKNGSKYKSIKRYERP